MRLVLDTNVAVSGLLWGGVPGRILRAALVGQVALSTSLALLRELEGVLGRKKFADRLARHRLDAITLVNGFAAVAEVVVPAPIPPVILHDPADDQVLATAVAARADMIVSGDGDLLAIGMFRDIRIVTAAEALGAIA